MKVKKPKNVSVKLNTEIKGIKVSLVMSWNTLTPQDDFDLTQQTLLNFTEDVSNYREPLEVMSNWRGRTKIPPVISKKYGKGKVK